MRFLLALAAVLLVGPVAAQMDVDQTYQLRAGFGDIATTDALEADGLWNVVQTLRVANATTVSLPLPDGGANAEATCDCAFTAAEADGAMVFTFANATSANVTLTTQHPYMGGAAFALAFPSAAPMEDAIILLHVPAGALVRTATPWDAGFPIVSTDGANDIYQTTQPGTMLWFAVQEAVAVAPVEDSGIDDVLWVIGGAILGAILWAVLVQQGVVQKRSRKQVASTSAHATASKEGKGVLEGRKRALMAALKDLELAKMNKELDTDAYDVLKADFKKQTVTVMRALEAHES